MAWEMQVRCVRCKLAHREERCVHQSEGKSGTLRDAKVT